MKGKKSLPDHLNGHRMVFYKIQPPFMIRGEWEWIRNTLELPPYDKAHLRKTHRLKKENSCEGLEAFLL